MSDDNVENLNEHRLRKAVDELETNEDILKFARWVNDHVTDEFTIISDYGMNYDLKINTKKETKDHIREQHNHYTQFQNIIRSIYNISVTICHVL